MKLLAKYVPVRVYRIAQLSGCQATSQKALEEHFYWLNLDLFGRPTYALSHRMLFQVGEAYFASDRHFYTGHDYNSLQQGVTALPTKDGTLVITLVRVSTDQVAGFWILGETFHLSCPYGALLYRPVTKPFGLKAEQAVSWSVILGIRDPPFHSYSCRARIHDHPFHWEYQSTGDGCKRAASCSLHS